MGSVRRFRSRICSLAEFIVAVVLLAGVGEPFSEVSVNKINLLPSPPLPTLHRQPPSSALIRDSPPASVALGKQLSPHPALKPDDVALGLGLRASLGKQATAGAPRRAGLHHLRPPSRLRHVDINREYSEKEMRGNHHLVVPIVAPKPLTRLEAAHSTVKPLPPLALSAHDCRAVRIQKPVPICVPAGDVRNPLASFGSAVPATSSCSGHLGLTGGGVCSMGVCGGECYSSYCGPQHIYSVTWDGGYPCRRWHQSQMVWTGCRQWAFKVRVKQTSRVSSSTPQPENLQMEMGTRFKHLSFCSFGSMLSGKTSLNVRTDLRLQSMLVFRFNNKRSRAKNILSPVKPIRDIRLKILNPRRHRPVRQPRGVPAVLLECNKEDPRCFWHGLLAQRPRRGHHLCLLHTKCSFQILRSPSTLGLARFYSSHRCDSFVVAQKLQLHLGWKIPRLCTLFLSY
ncbi:unnamed protein product [Urochloa humidicola]